MTRETKTFIVFEEEGVFSIKVRFTKLGELLRIIDFEGNRIASLLERDLLPKTETRTWDHVRRITVRV